MVMDGGSVISQQAMQQANSIHAAQAPSIDSPNANRVAREFVRQYYTILHESPVHLHRFYTDESDFIHGSIGSQAKAVRGQHEIHRTIIALNFRDCFAKIRYVDAQESVNKSVVVQVAGELSNSGGPMRRFMQTFLLVPISARKYYVRNDIFRYQDEIYVDDQEEVKSVEVPTTTQQPLLNGAGIHGGITNGGSTEPKEESENNQWDNSNASSQPTSTTTASTTQNSNRSQSPPSQTSSQPSQTSVKEPSPQPVNSGVRSWSQMVQKQTAEPVSAPPSNAQPTTGFGQTTTTFGGATAQGAPGRQRNAGHPKYNGSAPNQSANNPPSRQRDAPVKVREEETKPTIPDNQQLFVGNIPVEMSESSLADMFSKFGKVLEFKLAAPKNLPGGQKTTPNYGFVVFDCPETVQKILKNKEELFELEDGKSLRLNIEEKKPRMLSKGPRGSTGPPRERRPMMNGGKREFGRDGHNNGRAPRSGPPRQNPSGLPIH